jgi:hypothetical protein
MAEQDDQDFAINPFSFDAFVRRQGQSQAEQPNEHDAFDLPDIAALNVAATLLHPAPPPSTTFFTFAADGNKAMESNPIDINNTDINERMQKLESENQRLRAENQQLSRHLQESQRQIDALTAAQSKSQTQLKALALKAEIDILAPLTAGIRALRAAADPKTDPTS